MKRFSLSLIFCAATTLVAQNYTTYNGLPVSRVSFLRSQYSGHNVFSDSSLLLGKQARMLLISRGTARRTT